MLYTLHSTNETINSMPGFYMLWYKKHTLSACFILLITIVPLFKSQIILSFLICILLVRFDNHILLITAGDQSQFLLVN